MDGPQVRLPFCASVRNEPVPCSPAFASSICRDHGWRHPTSLDWSDDTRRNCADAPGKTGGTQLDNSRVGMLDAHTAACVSNDD